MKINLLFLTSLAFFFATLSGCTNEVIYRTISFNSLIKTTSELPGLNCPSGGLKVDVGLDSNRNGVLENSEINSTSYVCNGSGTNGSNGMNGANGFNTLIKTTAELPGLNCPTGGLKVNVGLDSNKNGVLDNLEINTTTFICNSSNGSFTAFSASISQTGTNPPVSIIINNPLNLVITWSRTSQGHYKGILSENLDLAKTIILSNNTGVLCHFQSSNEISLDNACGVNAYCDNFTNLNIEIRTY